MSSPSLQDELAQLQQEKQRLLADNQLLKEEVAELKRLIYGSKRERFVPTQKDDTQLSLELEVATADEEQTVVRQTVSYQRAVQRAGKKPVRQNFLDHLTRIDVMLEPEEDISTMRKIGEEVTEELDLEPARLGDPVCLCAGILDPGM